MFRLLSVLNQLSSTHPFLGHLRFRISQALVGYWLGFVHSTIIESGSGSDWTPFWANCISYADKYIFSSKRKNWPRLDLFYRIKRKSRSRIWESLAMPTALSKESSLFKKKVTVTPLIGGRRDSQLLTLIRLIAAPQKEGQPHPRYSQLSSPQVKE